MKGRINLKKYIILVIAWILGIPIIAGILGATYNESFADTLIITACIILLSLKKPEEP